MFVRNLKQLLCEWNETTFLGTSTCFFQERDILIWFSTLTFWSRKKISPHACLCFCSHFVISPLLSAKLANMRKNEDDDTFIAKFVPVGALWPCHASESGKMITSRHSGYQRKNMPRNFFHFHVSWEHFWLQSFFIFRAKNRSKR